MIGQYDVYLGKEVIGAAKMQREGLYWRVTCRCRLTGEVMYKLLLRCGKSCVNLGVLIPDGEHFVLDTRFPTKRLSGGKPEFTAMPRHSSPSGSFVPIYPEEPFSYLEKLKQAHLETRNGQIGIVIKEN